MQNSKVNVFIVSIFSAFFTLVFILMAMNLVVDNEFLTDSGFVIRLTPYILSILAGVQAGLIYYKHFAKGGRVDTGL